MFYFHATVINFANGCNTSGKMMHNLRDETWWWGGLRIPNVAHMVTSKRLTADAGSASLDSQQEVSRIMPSSLLEFSAEITVAEIEVLPIVGIFPRDNLIRRTRSCFGLW
jgi:hypothetical protein